MEFAAQEMDFASPEIEFGAPEMEFGTWEMEFGSPKIEFAAQKMELGSPEMEFGGPEIELGSPEMEFGSQVATSLAGLAGVGVADFGGRWRVEAFIARQTLQDRHVRNPVQSRGGSGAAKAKVPAAPLVRAKRHQRIDPRCLPGGEVAGDSGDDSQDRQHRGEGQRIGRRHAE